MNDILVSQKLADIVQKIKSKSNYIPPTKVKVSVSREYSREHYEDSFRLAYEDILDWIHRNSVVECDILDYGADGITMTCEISFKNYDDARNFEEYFAEVVVK